MVQVDPTLPTALNTEASIKAWVEDAVRSLPPEGGDIAMIKHWPPHHAKNEKVGEIWIVPALVHVVMDNGHIDNEMAFVAYHVDTGETTVELLYGIPDEQLPKYLEAKPYSQST